MVNFGEDMKFEKKTSYSMTNKTIKIKVVTFGEDIKLKQVDYNGDFKAVIE